VPLQEPLRPFEEEADIDFVVSGHGMGLPSKICIDVADDHSELRHQLPDLFGRRPLAHLAVRYARFMIDRVADPPAIPSSRPHKARARSESCAKVLGDFSAPLSK